MKIILKGGPNSGWHAPPKGTHSGEKHRSVGSGTSGESEVLDFGHLDVDPDSRFWNDDAKALRKAASELFEDQDASRKEFNTLSKYQQKEFLAINSELRSGNISNATKRKVKIMDGAFESAPPLSRDLYVYRGRPASVGDVMSDLAYMSTSLSPDVAAAFVTGKFGERDFSGVARVRIPAGSKVLWLGGFGGPEAKQFEVLLPRDTRLKSVGSNDFEYEENEG